MPGARQTGGLAIGRNLLPSPDEWAVRNRTLASTVSELINAHTPRTTGRGLEVGCQWGVFLDAMAADTDLRWWGADPVIGRHLSRTGRELVNGVADDLPFPDMVFDCVVLANVYEHIHPQRRDASLAEMRRVLVPGGILVGQLPNPHFPIESHSKLPFMGWLPVPAQSLYWKISPARRGAGFHSVTVRDLERRAVRAGLEVVLVRTFSYPPEAAPPSVRWAVRLLQRASDALPWSWQFVLRRQAEVEVQGGG
jgi:SAM-dependent methyltransferase